MKSEKKPVLRIEKCFKFSKHETYQEDISKGIQLFKGNVCSFWKDNFPWKFFLANPVQMIVSETETKGDSERATVADPEHGAIYRSVSVLSKLWICSHWCLMLKLHQLGTKMELHLWCIPGCVPYALCLALLGHGPSSPGFGKHKGLASLGILLEMRS